MKKIKKIFYAIFVIGILIACIAGCGDLDSHEYIEVNSTPKPKYINY